VLKKSKFKLLYNTAKEDYSFKAKVHLTWPRNLTFHVLVMVEEFEELRRLPAVDATNELVDSTHIRTHNANFSDTLSIVYEPVKSINVTSNNFLE